MTKTRKIAAIASMMVVLLTAATGWVVAPRASHEIVLAPVQGAQR